MSLDAFTQAFAETDWNTLAASAARQAAAARSTRQPAAANGAAHHPTTGTTTGLAAGDAPSEKSSGADPSFLTFSDVVAAINPLQQIPIIDGIYRHYTGDTIRPQGTILGGLLYGGLIGGAIATASVLVHEVTGVDPEEAVIAYLTGDDAADGAVQTATAPRPAATQTAANASSGPAGGPTTAAPSAVAEANQAALRQFAADLAGGGRTTSGTPAAPGAQTAALPAATPASGPGPLIAGLPDDGQPHPTRMPLRGGVQNNPNPPPPPAFAAMRHFGGFSQPVAPATAAPAAVATAAGAGNGNDPGAAGSGTGPPAGAALAARSAPVVRAARPPGVVLPVGTNRSLYRVPPAPAPTAPSTPANDATALKPPAAPQAPPARPLDPAKPITDPPPLPAEPLTPDTVSQLMMRNLDKYQAMARAAAHLPPKPAGTVPDV
jgi:hypothetical protein